MSRLQSSQVSSSHSCYFYNSNLQQELVQVYSGCVLPSFPRRVQGGPTACPLSQFVHQMHWTATGFGDVVANEVQLGSGGCNWDDFGILSDCWSMGVLITWSNCSSPEAYNNDWDRSMGCSWPWLTRVSVVGLVVAYVYPAFSCEKM